MRRVEVASGLPHRPARGISDRMSPVADGPAARALWAAEQRRLHASLRDLRAGAPRPGMVERDRQAFRFGVPVLLALAFMVAWGEWTTRLGEAFSQVRIAGPVVTARVDAWIDPPPYTRQPPVFLSRSAPPARPGAAQSATAEPAPAAADGVSVPEGSTLSIRVVSQDAATLTLTTDAGSQALTPTSETGAAPGADAGSDDVIRAYEAVLDRDATVAITHDGATASYPVAVIEDRPPTITRGPMTVNQSASFQLAFDVADDYGVTEGRVTFLPAPGVVAEGARPLVEPPFVPLRIDRSNPRQGPARAEARLEAHPYAGVEVEADAVVKDAAGQEARPAESARMALPAKRFYKPLARALVEQRRILALDANQRPRVTQALDALTIAPARIDSAGIYLGLRSGYERLVAARSDDDLRGVLDYLWTMARAIEEGELSSAEQRLSDAREALQKALEEGAPQEEIQRLMQELRQAMQEFLESYAAEMAERGMQNPQQMPQMPGDMQELSDQDLQELLDRIEDLAQLGDTEAAQELLSQLQQMLDNLQMAQPGQMSPQDQEAMQQMDELAQMMREQQRLMDETFELNQGRRPGQRPGETGEPLSPEELEQLMQQLQEGQGQLAEQLRRMMEQLQGQMADQGQQGQEGEGEGQGQGEQGQPGEGQGQMGQGMQPGEGPGRSLGRAGRSMGEAGRSLGEGAPGDAYGHQGDAMEALRDGLQGMMQQMYAQQGQGQQGQQMGGRPGGDRDPLGRPQREEGHDLGQTVKVPDEIDVERARRILEAIRERLGERFRSRHELDYLERLLDLR